jgi:hypothetical protein
MMDPNTTWEQLLCAYAAGDWDLIEETATDLLKWLDQGGFPPTIVNRPGIDDDWNVVLARASCVHVLEVVHNKWRPIQ